jgi:endoglucanase
MDYLLHGEARALSATNKINTWIKTKTGNDPERIRNGYRLNGAAIGTGYDLPFVAPLAVSAMVSTTHQAWLDKLWTSITARKLNDGDYFGNTLKMLALIAISGNAWKPD